MKRRAFLSGTVATVAAAPAAVEAALTRTTPLPPLVVAEPIRLEGARISFPELSKPVAMPHLYPSAMPHLYPNQPVFNFTVSAGYMTNDDYSKLMSQVREEHYKMLRDNLAMRLK